MWESFFRWTTQYSKSKKTRFISVGKPLISGPKLRHCPGKYKTHNPFAHFLLNKRPIEKQSKCKKHSDLRVQWNLWKTARCGSTGCHGGFMSWGSSKKQGVGLNCQVTLFRMNSKLENQTIFPLKTSEHFFCLEILRNCGWRSNDFQAPNLADWLDETFRNS